VAKSKYKVGDVVWAIATDRSGNNSKERPHLVIHPGPDNKLQSLYCLCISTDPKEAPDDPAIELPWAADGTASTGLREWSRAVLLWHRFVEQEEVLRRTGNVPQRLLAHVIEQRQIAMDYRPR
jgi:hypothetical protein